MGQRTHPCLLCSAVLVLTVPQVSQVPSPTWSPGYGTTWGTAGLCLPDISGSAAHSCGNALIWCVLRHLSGASEKGRQKRGGSLFLRELERPEGFSNLLTLQSTQYNMSSVYSLLYCFNIITQVHNRLVLLGQGSESILLYTVCPEGDETLPAAKGS